MAEEIRMLLTIEEIKKRLKTTGKQQKDLAKAASVSGSAVSQMLRSGKISRDRVLQFAKELGGTTDFWDALIEEDMKQNKSQIENSLCTLFRAENGDSLPVHHVDYRDDPEKAGQYMASILRNLHSAGFRSEPS
ncbi:MAG: helix-turn-helix domain-containing protein [Pseudomonadota bacterium]